MLVFKAVSHCSWLFKLSLLLICLEVVLGWRWSDLVRVKREEPLGFNNDSNETTTTDATTTDSPTTTFSPTTDLATSTADMATTTGELPTPALSANAIANIIASGVAIVFLTVVLCYLMATFNQVEHRDRVRTALQRNKQIDRQIAAARARQQQRSELDREGFKVETVGGAGDGRGLEVTVETHKELGQEKVPITETNDSSKSVIGEKSVVTAASSDVVVDIEDKVSGSSSVDGDDKPLISVREEGARLQPVLLVQPAQPEELV